MISPKQLRLPPTAEFVARCGMVAHRRFRGSKKRGPAPIAIHPKPLSPDELKASLQKMGIEPGDSVLVHSDTGAITSAGWTPSDMIDFLLDYVGPDGTLMMPTHPKLKRISGKLTYKVRRSPSKVGMMTELFRRRSEAIRSQFPFSSAAAIGPRAHEFLDDHINSFAPHDEHSPYAKIAAADGKLLCIGCDLDRMTVLHVAEDKLRDQLGIDNFHQTRTTYVVDGDEETKVVAHTRSPWLWWYLNLSRWRSNMYRNKIATDVRVSGISLRSASALRMTNFMELEIKSGNSLYPLAKMNRWLKLAEPQLEAA